MSGKFLIRRRGSRSNIAHMRIAHAVDSLTAYELQETITSLMQSGLYKYVLDFYDVEYISSFGIEILYLLDQELREGGGGLILINVCARICILFDIIGVRAIFKLADTLELAIEEFESDEQ